MPRSAGQLVDFARGAFGAIKLRRATVFLVKGEGVGRVLRGCDFVFCEKQIQLVRHKREGASLGRTFRRALPVLAALLALDGFVLAVPAHAQSALAAQLGKPTSLPDIAIGSAKAPVTITEYSSMSCPHCAAWGENVFPMLRSRYIDTGKVRFVFREFPLDIKAAAGSMLARCIAKDDPGKYFAVVDMLFRQQNEWALKNTTETLIRIGKQAGLSQQQVEDCLKDQALLDKIAGLERALQGVQSPALIEQVIEQRELQSELSRFAASKPLYAQVEADLPYFITKAKTQLGESVGRTAILDKAYELAVQADPALRAQTQAAPAATNGNAAKAEAARRANGVNVTSTSTGKAKQPSLDDELGSIWDKARKA